MSDYWWVARKVPDCHHFLARPDDDWLARVSSRHTISGRARPVLTSLVTTLHLSTLAGLVIISENNWIALLFIMSSMWPRLVYRCL